MSIITHWCQNPHPFLTHCLRTGIHSEEPINQLTNWYLEWAAAFIPEENPDTAIWVYKSWKASKQSRRKRRTLSRSFCQINCFIVVIKGVNKQTSSQTRNIAYHRLVTPPLPKILRSRCDQNASRKRSSWWRASVRPNSLERANLSPVDTPGSELPTQHSIQFDIM